MAFQRPQFAALAASDDAREILSLPDLIRFNALNNPHHCFGQEAAPDLASAQQITFRQLAHAVGSTCGRLLDGRPGLWPARLQPSGRVDKCTPVALLMESGPSLFFHLAALLTLNIPCLLLSIRLSPAAASHLLKHSKAQLLIASPRTLQLANAALQHEPAATSNCAIAMALPVDEVLTSHNDSSATGYAQLVDQTRRCVRESDPNVLILHSSGTTGMPKLLSMAHRYMLGYAACHEFAADSDESTRGLNISTLPLFHGFGLLAPCLALSVGKPVLFPPSAQIPTAETFISLVEKFPVGSAMTVPSILDDFSVSPDFNVKVGHMKKLSFVAVGGGAIKPAVGRALHENGIALLNHFGATELGALAPIFHPDTSYDWGYLRLRTDLGLILAAAPAESAQGEQQDITPGHRLARIVGQPFAWEHSFELQDKVSVMDAARSYPHTYIRLFGRKDDTIVLASGEKVSPHVMEEQLAKSPYVKRAVVFGTGRFNVGVIIELQAKPQLNGHADSVHDRDATLRWVWPEVQAANLLVDQHAVVASPALVVLAGDKPIPLSDKGVPQRKRVFEDFAAEIDEAYARLESVPAELDASMAISECDSIAAAVHAMVMSCLPLYATAQRDLVQGDSDLFTLGLDSVLALKLHRLLAKAAATSSLESLRAAEIPRDVIYTHPSIQSLSQYLMLVASGTPPSAALDSASLMASLFAEYDMPPSQVRAKSDNKLSIVVTGANGHIASHAVHTLCQLEHVESVVCLTRTTSPQECGFAPKQISRVLESLASRGLSLEPAAASKIAVYQYVLGAANLGLDAPTWDRLAAQLTHILHAAWPMDFARRLPSFKPQLECMRDLINLARHAQTLQPGRKAKLTLVSSIAAVGNAPTSTPVPESFTDDPATPLEMGYAQAKWICEKLLLSAAAATPNVFSAAVVRVAQVAGDNDGHWNPAEHMPALMRACRGISKIPRLDGTYAWLALPTTARVLVDLLLAPPAPASEVLHIENPVRAPFADFTALLAAELRVPQAHRDVYFVDWLEEAVRWDPALEALRHFFLYEFPRLGSGRLRLDTAKARAASRTLRTAGAPSRDLLVRWIRGTE